MVLIGIILLHQIESNTLVLRNRGKIGFESELLQKPPWTTPSLSSVATSTYHQTTQSNREVVYTENEKLNEFKHKKITPVMSDRWEVHHQIPETATDVTEYIAKATKAILDPYKVLELVVKTIPESLRVMGWYLALAVTFLWCLVVFIIGGYATLQALKMIFGVTKYCGKGIRSCISEIHEKKLQRARRTNQMRIKETKPIVKTESM